MGQLMWLEFALRRRPPNTKNRGSGGNVDESECYWDGELNETSTSARHT